MLKNPSVAIVTASVFLLLYAICLGVESLQYYLGYLFAIAPVIYFWMAYSIIRFGEYHGKDLLNEEWGYQDRNKEDLGVF